MIDWTPRTEADGKPRYIAIADAIEHDIEEGVLTCGREASAVSLYDLCFLAGETWQEQAERAFQ